MSRHKLKAEKHALAETGARRARLTEAILYETAGSQVDAYASVNRSRIKSLFLRLGIAGDPLLAFKDMAGAIASPDGAARRAGFALRAFFAFKGQRKLIAAAILLVLAGAGLRIAFDQQAVWLAWLRGAESSVPVANWLEAHIDWLLGLREIIFVGAALAFGVTVWRGLQLIRLVFRGADLLQADLDVRRRETDDLFAFQARHVEGLAAEVNILSAAPPRRKNGPATCIRKAPRFRARTLRYRYRHPAGPDIRGRRRCQDRYGRPSEHQQERRGATAVCFRNRSSRCRASFPWA